LLNVSRFNYTEVAYVCKLPLIRLWTNRAVYASLKSDSTKNKNNRKIKTMDNNQTDNFIPSGAGAPEPGAPAEPLGDAKSQIAGKLKDANNILVTVSRNPSVDQLAACIGLTLLLNKMNKHAAAVFSGEVPSTLEFLKPEETFEKNTDSLRDFIIALDKSKAAKLRYKVENDVVRIFITPYRTSISQDDLEFSQGDFNVDLVLGLGVQNQEDLDEVIQENGRILHDATVATINLTSEGGLGSLNWHDPGASSLSELATELSEDLGKELIDNQIATALLTGIVAETDRFSNEKTSPRTMSTSSALMTAGANQQLVASELAKPPSDSDDNNDGEDFGDENGHIDHEGPSDDKPSDSGDGSLDIAHEDDETGAEPLPEEQPPAGPSLPEIPAEPERPSGPLVITPLESSPAPEPPMTTGPGMLTEPPLGAGPLTANAAPEALDPLTDPLSLASLQQHHLLVSPTGDPAAAAPPSSAPAAAAPAPVPMPDPMPAAPAPMPMPPAAPAPDPITPPAPPLATAPAVATPALTPVDSTSGANPPGPDQTITDLESTVNSPHAEAAVADARDEVALALAANAQVAPSVARSNDPLLNPVPNTDMSFDPTAMGITTEAAPPAGAPALTPDTSAAPAAAAPPPVPPPIPFQFGAPPSTPGV
jgi:hypothetical protein